MLEGEQQGPVDRHDVILTGSVSNKGSNSSALDKVVGVLQCVTRRHKYSNSTRPVAAWCASGWRFRRQSRDKEMTKKDKRTGRQTGRGGGWGKGELRGGDVPCCHTKGVPFALASRTGGKRPGGGVAHLKRERAWSPKGLTQAGGR